MFHRGVATFTLDHGRCPPWLFERMVRLGREMVRIIVEECGPNEFIHRISDPVWFQSLGTVLAFDWNASGLTTILTAALKEAIRFREKELGVFICGGKGKTSLKTPDEIELWGGRLSFPEQRVNTLVYNSKMVAKVDSSLLQDGFQLYHHSFFFSKNGAWAVVQQGMNKQNKTARRYHWYSEKITDLVCEPHSGIVTQRKTPTLDLTSLQSANTRTISTQLVQGTVSSLMKDVEIIRKHSSGLSQMVSIKTGQTQTTALTLAHREFHWHPVLHEDFSRSKYLEKIFSKVCELKPKNYEHLLATAGVGPKTMRALSLIAEVIYGAPPSYKDPARYSFAHGGKDSTPYPVDQKTYDTSIEFFRAIVSKSKIPFTEKGKILARLRK